MLNRVLLPYRRALLGPDRLPALAVFLLVRILHRGHLLLEAGSLLKQINDLAHDVPLFLLVWPLAWWAKEVLPARVLLPYRRALLGPDRLAALTVLMLTRVLSHGYVLREAGDVIRQINNVARDVPLALLLWPLVWWIKDALPPVGREQTVTPAAGASTAPPAAVAVSRSPGRRMALWAALALALAFGLHGITWGRFECWNGDAMAMLPLGPGYKPTLYVKPPLLTYLTHLIVLDPGTWLEHALHRPGTPPLYLDEAKLTCARLLVIGMFLGTIGCVYTSVRRTAGNYAAAVAVLCLGTSAGFVEFNHFLTCDSALLLPMTAVGALCVMIALRGSWGEYLLAGFLTGAAFNMKYNGLAVGIGIPVAHVLGRFRIASTQANAPNPTGPPAVGSGAGLAVLIRMLPGIAFSPRLIAGLAAVPLGLIVTNPYVILDYARFKSDFLYNYVITPVYGGTRVDPGYFRFLEQFGSIYGFPVALLTLFLFGVAVWRALRDRLGSPERNALTLIAASIALLYYAKLGGFARTPARFVLPTAPFVLLAASPCLAAANEACRRRLAWVFAPLLAYNLASSAAVGSRFLADPRLAASDWLAAHVFPGCRIETGEYCPHWGASWHRLHLEPVNASTWRAPAPGSPNTASTPALAGESRPEAPGYDIRMPDVDLEQLNIKLAEQFPDNKAVLEHVTAQTPVAAIFSATGLAERNPDYVIVTHFDFGGRDPLVAAYYDALDSGQMGYAPAFTGTSPKEPAFLYPKGIDFLKNTTIIYARKTAAEPGRR